MRCFGNVGVIWNDGMTLNVYLVLSGHWLWSFGVLKMKQIGYLHMERCLQPILLPLISAVCQ